MLFIFALIPVLEGKFRLPLENLGPIRRINADTSHPRISRIFLQSIDTFISASNSMTNFCIGLVDTRIVVSMSLHPIVLAITRSLAPTSPRAVLKSRDPVLPEVKGKAADAATPRRYRGSSLAAVKDVHATSKVNLA